MAWVERGVAKFGSHQEAEEAGLARHRRMTPAERLDILLELIARHREGTDAA